MATYEEQIRGDRALREMEEKKAVYFDDLTRMEWKASCERVAPPHEGGPIIFVDGGARNGTRELRGIAGRVEVYGFEPSLEEFQKLKPGPYYKVVNFQKALGEKAGLADLYISRRPGATSTLRPNEELLAEFRKDNWSEMAEIVEEAWVDVVTLRSLDLPYIDYLKLDTQGNELGILRGADLEKVGVIKTEVEMIRIYKDQSLIGEVCNYLDLNGFELVDIDFTEPCRRFHVNPDLEGKYRLVWADAVFYRKECARRKEQALVLGELGYQDLAIHLDPQLKYPEKSRLRKWIDPPKQVNSLR